MHESTSKLLLDEVPLVIQPSLARAIGLNEAIVLQQVHYWVVRDGKPRDGSVWTYGSIREWHEQLPFGSYKTTQRTFAGLVKSGLLISGNFNRAGFDKTTWYRVDHDRLNAFLSNRLGQIDPMDDPNLSDFQDNLTQPIPETREIPESSLRDRLPESANGAAEPPATPTAPAPPTTSTPPEPANFVSWFRATWDRLYPGHHHGETPLHDHAAEGARIKKLEGQPREAVEASIVAFFKITEAQDRHLFNNQRVLVFVQNYQHRILQRARQSAARASPADLDALLREDEAKRARQRASLEGRTA